MAVVLNVPKRDWIHHISCLIVGDSFKKANYFEPFPRSFCEESNLLLLVMIGSFQRVKKEKNNYAFDIS